MPKDNIDYSNTIIYKIYCNDSSVTDIYVGHTTNFIKRKYQHKVLCNKKSKLKIYDIIQKNGGWNNWTMIEIAKYVCQDVTEARIREQEHYELLKPSLNTINPISKSKPSALQIDTTISLEKDNTISFSKDDAILSKQDEDDNIIILKYSCTDCCFITNKKSNYDAHLLTRKHKLAINGTLEINKIQPFQATEFTCTYCNKIYKDNSGLWRHKKKCIEDNEKIKENVITDKELIVMLVKQNSQLMDALKNGTNNTNINTNNTNINSHNKTFNLQVFLNETCKNAMNIDEFVSSIKPQLADLEATGRLGYVEGVSNIIIRNLNSLNIHDRPFHCSDQKREVIYIKDNNEWTREDNDKPILTKAIKSIANENIKNINEWRKEHPDCVKSDSKKNNLYLKIVSNSMCGLTKEETDKNINKIISNLAKKVVIDKTL